MAANHDCTAKGIGVLTYSPLMQGLLTGAWAPPTMRTYRARTSTAWGEAPSRATGEGPGRAGPRKRRRRRGHRGTRIRRPSDGISLGVATSLLTKVALR